MGLSDNGSQHATIFLVWEGLVCESKRLQDIWLQDGTHIQQ